MNSKILTLSCLVLLITACGQKDRAYYEANLDDAISKAEECEARMKAAFMAQNEESLKAVGKDQECKFAMDVNHAHQKELAIVKRELEKEEQEKKRKLEEEAYKVEYEKQIAQLKLLNYREFYAVHKECISKITFKPSAKCKAEKTLRPSKEQEEIAALKNKFTNGKLEEFEKKSCFGSQYDQAYCKLSRKASDQQQDEKVQYYLANRSVLKSDFNDCHLERKRLWSERKIIEANAYLRTYKCRMAARAGREVNAMTFQRPML
ncbi:hypothetical protein SOPP22_01575 [Shewanella sp. OPT22]|nr:hypothetical protein SOPP22_01575 [Shewanella sp. OPT22]